jgi:membrane peptidoglycan carboxypeptidase
MISRFIRAVLENIHPLQSLARLARLLLWGIAAFHACLFVLILISSLFLSRWNPPVTSLMTYRALTAHTGANPVVFVPLSRIPRSAQLMFISLEDLKFYRHFGIDPGAIRDAYRVNKAIGYTLYGGSTITQQLARTLFLTPRKTYVRKYVEALIAVEMDLVLKKQRILELYINYIELGRGVYGIGAASWASFGHSAATLSVDEFRRLVSILPNPIRFTVDTFNGSRQMAERYRYLVEHFPDPQDSTEPAAPPADASPTQPEVPPAQSPAQPDPASMPRLISDLSPSGAGRRGGTASPLRDSV